MAAWLTTEDEANYGRELLDVSQRAALHAISPELQDIRNQNAELQRRLAKEARHRLDQQLEQAVPTYREIDRDAGWHRWLLGIDALSGEVRQRLLNAAIQRGDAASVIAFFRGYQRESGNQSLSSAASAPNRTRSSSSGKPIYTRDQVKELYARHQRGEFAGQEAAWARQEVDLIRASAEGRILNPVDVAGK